MKARMIDECGRRAALALVLVVVPALATDRPQQSPSVPAINVVLLDDQALGLSPQTELRRNDWTTWQVRLPSFLGKLALVAEFRRAMGDERIPGASLYGLEVQADLAPQRREALVASELAHIHAATKRPTVILARSSAGEDQLRIVFQDARDYTPAHAAKFLRVLGEISPAIAHRRIAASFGPFNPPPTLVFDPRVSALCAADDAEQAGARR